MFSIDEVLLSIHFAIPVFHSLLTARQENARGFFRPHSALLISPPAMICQVRRADVIQYSRGLIAPSLHTAVEGLPLVARASKGGLTLTVGHVAVTVFNLTLGGGGVAYGWRVAQYWGLLNDWWLDDWGRLDDSRLLGGAFRCQ